MSVFRRLSESSETAVSAGLLLLRLWFGLVLALGHGLAKVENPAGFVGNLTMAGFPLAGFFGWAAMLSEFLGGLLVALGLLTRPAAALVMTTMFVAGLKIHAADPFAKKELAFAYGFAALVVVVAGPGRFSLDALLARRRG